MRSSSDLLQKARAGDSAALEKLLSLHEGQVLRFGLRMCGDEEDARDVLQETLLAAFRNLHDFRGEAQLSTWLYRIARSHCMKKRRYGSGALSTRSLEDSQVAAVSSEELLPDAQAHARQMGALLQSAIASLPESQREVLVLRDVHGLSAQEAARLVGIGMGAVKSRLHRARMALRDLLVKSFEPDDDVHPARPPKPRCARRIAAVPGLPS